MRKIFSALFLLLLLASACFADAVPGDVIVVLRNTSGQRLMSAGNTEGAFKTLSAVQEFTQSVNANVKRTYDALSSESGLPTVSSTVYDTICSKKSGKIPMS